MSMLLDNQIEELELDEMDASEIEKTVSALSAEGMEYRRKRKEVRYKLYRLFTEAHGGPSAEVDKKFKKKFEKQKNFSGWKWFGINWDVSITDPYECVHRDKSQIEEWNELVQAKFPRIEPGGKVTYPDINIRKKVEKHHNK